MSSLNKEMISCGLLFGCTEVVGHFGEPFMPLQWVLTQTLPSRMLSSFAVQFAHPKPVLVEPKHWGRRPGWEHFLACGA